MSPEPNFAHGLVLDACVLIDYLKTDRYILPLMSKHLGRVLIPSPIIVEVEDFKEVEVVSELGIAIIEPNIDDVFNAATGVGSLSFQDRICLLVAKRASATCVTNDKRLRKNCANEGVQTIWGLEALVLIHESGRISSNEAWKIIMGINEINPKYVTQGILDRLSRRLGR